MMKSIKLWASVAAIAIAIGIYAYLNCGYGPVSKDSYELVTAVHNACVTRDVGRVEMLSEMIAKAEIDSRERKWLNQIIIQAENGDWNSARKASRSLLEKQVSYIR